MDSKDEYGFERTCRTCKRESSDLRSLFDESDIPNGQPRIDEMLMSCTSIQVKIEDGLPASICLLCVDELAKAYAFKLKCQQTECSLRSDARKIVPSHVKQELLTADNIFAEPLNESKGESKDESLSCRADFIEILDNNQMLLTCRECSKIFTTLDGLKGHKRLHSGTLFQCKYCCKGFTRQTHLYRHEVSHVKHKLHVCKICNKTLSRFEHLKRHLTTHMKEKPFSCTICQRGFNRSDHLDVHRARCKGEKVHVCNVCNRGFLREDSLEVHKRIHANQTPTLPTIDSIDKIDDYYYQIEHDPKTVYMEASDTEEFSEVPDDDMTTESYNENKDNIENNACNDQDDDNEDDNDDDDNDDNNSDNNVDNDNNDDNDNNETTSSLLYNIDQTNHIELNTEMATHKLEIYEDENVDEKTADFIKSVFDLPIITSDINDQPIQQENIDDSDHNSVCSEYLPSSRKSVSKARGRGRGRARGRGRGRGNPGRPRINLPSGKSLHQTKATRTVKREDENGDYTCCICYKKFHKLSVYEKHAIEHAGLNIHTCNHCNKQFTRLAQLRRHMISHSDTKPFPCDICSKRFSRRDHLQQHMRWHQTVKEPIVCDLCQKPFHRRDQLIKHKALKHNIGEKIVSEKKFNCPVCTKSFTTEKYRDVHVKGHTGDKQFQCKTCTKCFLSKSHLTEHMKFHNDNSKKFLCSECGQRFIRNDYLIIHMRRHRGEKPFKCKFCGKGFPRTTDLTVHERYHTGEKTHLCTVCGRGFGRAYNLTVHMRTHTGEKPYQCTYCDAAFAQGNDLKAHVRRHTGERFQCELCVESFLMGYLLTQHKRTVHGLNVVSNIRRLTPVSKLGTDPDEPQPITIPLPKPVVPDSILTNLQLAAHIQQSIKTE